MKKNIIVFAIAVFLTACGTKEIPIDTVAIDGTAPGAVEVLNKAKEKLKGIRSYKAEVIAVQESDFYGSEKLFEGKIEAEYAGKSGTLGNIWYETKQSMKGKN
ncbi:MAG: hypothetical protein ACEPO8_11470, partial [Rhodothermaceae bacterium]